MKSPIKISLVIITAGLLVFVAALSCVQWTVLSDAFFYSQYQKNEVVLNTGIELDELMRLTDDMQAYLFGAKADFQSHAVINQMRRPVFGEREILHMEDVRNLFAQGLLLRNAAGGLLIVLIFYLWQKNREVLFTALQSSLILAFFAVVGIGTALALYFDSLFVLFHEVLFSNDLWILDPAESILVNMVPLPFFMAISRLILCKTFAILICAGAIGTVGARSGRLARIVAKVNGNKYR